MAINQYSTGLQHLGIPTLNVSKSKVFYEGLGFTCIHEKTIHDGKQQVCFMRLNDLVLELYEETQIANKARSN